jgi:hypothetical protein
VRDPSPLPSPLRREREDLVTASKVLSGCAWSGSRNALSTIPKSRIRAMKLLVFFSAWSSVLIFAPFQRRGGRGRFIDAWEMGLKAQQECSLGT